MHPDIDPWHERTLPSKPRKYRRTDSNPPTYSARMRYDLVPRIARRKEMTLSEPDESKPNESNAILDLDQTLTCTDGDTAMLMSIVELFAVEGPNQLDAIRDRIENQDAVGIQRAAHQLKGSVVIFGAARAECAALNLEQTAAQGDQNQIAEAWNDLSKEVATLMRELKSVPQQLRGLESGDDSAIEIPTTEGPLQ